MIRDDDVIELLSGANTLLDAYLLQVGFCDNGNGTENITLKFRAREGSDYSDVSLRFTQVLEFGFHSDDARLGDVCDLKFFKLDDNSFYISLDPDPWSMPEAGAAVGQVSDSDNFVVRAKHIDAIASKLTK